ncbi:hypothetical protein [Archangium gephyra]|uniref:Uncharacterized protein n=1 Tax=Archangium gephyra TaxID=48 RepID=A0AAC8TEF1_9BACT|nr:hypothetical protein [Archangium gephyra]AKJ02863.1 Hypothetical protein AA314_04489 [Archangium gephyra]
MASGNLQGIDFRLRDTGVHWRLELPLARPLLPSGVVLLPAKARSLGSLYKLRPLQLQDVSASPGPFAWYSGRDMPRGRVEPSEAFLEEARRAMEAHAPLEVVPDRLVHTPRAGSQLSVGDVREAVRTLDTTARRWLDAVERHGLPRVEALPPVPSLLSRLPRVRLPRVRLPRVRIPLKPVLTVLGGLLLLFSCCFPFLSMVRGSWTGTRYERTGEVVGRSWSRTIRQMRCPHVLRTPADGGDASSQKNRGCDSPWKEVDYLKTSGSHSQPPRWPEPSSVRAEDYLWREEHYTLTIEYEDGGKKLVTYQFHSEELYRRFSKEGQQVSFRLERGRLSHLRPR